MGCLEAFPTHDAWSRAERKRGACCCAWRIVSVSEVWPAIREQKCPDRGSEHRECQQTNLLVSDRSSHDASDPQPKAFSPRGAVLDIQIRNIQGFGLAGLWGYRSLHPASRRALTCLGVSTRRCGLGLGHESARIAQGHSHRGGSLARMPLLGVIKVSEMASRKIAFKHHGPFVGQGTGSCSHPLII